MIKKELNIYGDNIVECLKVVELINIVFHINTLKLSNSSNFSIPKIIIKNTK
ncbi:uncharacterized protein METZ01_LOCUS184225, partial [marine metagenome]